MPGSEQLWGWGRDAFTVGDGFGDGVRWGDGELEVRVGVEVCT